MMHTTSRTKLAAHSGYVKWRGTLDVCGIFASCGAADRLGHFRVGTQSQVCETGRVASRLASPGVMLVESDVCQHICGIVP